MSGFSMALAGSSAPASGAEHLVSHYWDMEELCQGRAVRALHGAAAARFEESPESFLTLEEARASLRRDG